MLPDPPDIPKNILALGNWYDLDCIVNEGSRGVVALDNKFAFRLGKDLPLNA